MTATANQLISRIISRIEMDKNAAPDFKRLMLTERMKLQSALRTRDADLIRKQTAEITRIAENWGVEL